MQVSTYVYCMYMYVFQYVMPTISETKKNIPKLGC